MSHSLPAYGRGKPKPHTTAYPAWIPLEPHNVPRTPAPEGYRELFFIALENVLHTRAYARSFKPFSNPTHRQQERARKAKEHTYPDKEDMQVRTVMAYFYWINDVGDRQRIRQFRAWLTQAEERVDPKLLRVAWQNVGLMDEDEEDKENEEDGEDEEDKENEEDGEDEEDKLDGKDGEDSEDGEDGQDGQVGEDGENEGSEDKKDDESEDAEGEGEDEDQGEAKVNTDGVESSSKEKYSDLFK